MKWFKKLKGLFNEEEIENDDVPLTNTTHQNKRIPHKNIDTKVTYQYPKGQFKFPIIPDGNDDRTKSKRTSRQEHTVGQQPIRLKPKQEKQHSTSEQEKKKKPFRPTEIPSAVHGFKPPVTRLAKEESVIEFELPSIDNSNLRQQLPVFRNGLEETSVTIEKEFENAHQDAQAETLISTNESAKTVDISDLLNKLQIDEDIKEQEDELPIEMEPPEAQENINVHKFVEDQPLIPIRNEDERAQAVDQELVTESVVEIENEDNIAEEVEQSDPPRNVRSGRPIPFNVLMLKQDRKKQQEVRDQEAPVFQSEYQETTEQAVQTQQVQRSVGPLSREDTNVQQGIAKNNESTQKALTDTPDNHSGYTFPSLSYLNQQIVGHEEDENWVEDQRELLDEALKSFKVRAQVVNVTQGPAVTRFEVQPEPGVKVNKITNLSDDIKLNLSAKEIRIEAPIPGKNTIGIEVPNKVSKPVFLHEIVNSQEFRNSSSPLTVALGLDISGNPIITDLNKMPHGLIAGATGSGKSVCINTMLVSLMYKAAPHEVKLLLIDPKMVELAPYNHIPHLVSPVITDVKAATAALKWAVEEMERRYELFAHSGVRDISRYNELVDKHQELSGRLPYLVIIIDELADLMMVAPGDVEEAICRIAQKARACGIHLILATQRPSVDVITGLIKANIPTRIAFSVSSQVDSRTIIDSSGAEKLLGKGDMLFLENGSSKPKRVQGNFVSDEEIELVVSHVKKEVKPSYLFEQDELIKKHSNMSGDDDELFPEACEFVFEQGGASTSSVQRRFRIGYNRAARLIDMMEDQGIISEARGSKPREILISEDELNSLQEN
ncbi:DNA translocase FtsK [Litchfieldia salsa]|uniref:DNA segregation ATPase FtsK/SpoIIIE, S-DNA-T family n=1 Tax=Litchfieldia salsa TaxID=930152 RepID=A0A1H0P7J8_9BACI|nr:DNA translocase FtsK [Litchfieldia salsa]SDP00708.1 DNA segregation ATPase FtsK/SpoIIIE, S-DNA-T family [Litchfieldia salsa]